MRYIVDRFEGQFAVCENEKQEMVNIPAGLLPQGVKEGDVLDESDGSYWIMRGETRKTKAEAEKLMNDVFE